MGLNPIGAVIVGDGNNPRIFTGRARTTITAGDLVVVSGAANVVSSGADSFITSDVVVDLIHDSHYCNGIAVTNAGSNSLVSVARQGDFIVRSAGIISGGQSVVPFSGTVQGVVAQSTGSATAGGRIGMTIGTSITAAASGTANNFTLIGLNI